DSDGDGVSDKKEIAKGTNPLKPPQKEKEEQKNQPPSRLKDAASTGAALLQEARQQYAPRAIKATQNAIKILDKRADYAAKIIRTKKDHLKPTQYQSLFAVSLALLLPLAEHWRIAGGILIVILFWLLLRRLRR
ncbi:MAG: hypothetical protein HY006_03305, partial [Candidatus Sungbacteria bacterium]|nr:hypothetical protein [Candidatus Sungbacteria bacterium]